jgi:PAS domain S-box-containing protein
VVADLLNAVAAYENSRLAVARDNESLRRLLDEAPDLLEHPAAAVRALLNAVRDPALLISPEGTVLETNAATCERIGLPADRIVGAHALSLIGPEAAATRRPYLERAAATKQPVEFVDERNGRHFEHRIYPICNSGGDLVALALYARDVTDVRSAMDALVAGEEQLRASEEQFRLLIERMDDCLWRIDLDGFLTYVSPSVQELTGYEPRELEGQRFSVIFSDKDKSLAEEAFARRLESGGEGGSNMMTLIHRRKDGSEFTGEVRATPVRDANGEFVALQGITRDITREHEAERALAASEARYRAMIEMAHEGVATIGPDGIVVHANERLASMLGYRRDELVGRAIGDFIPDSEMEDHARRVARREGGIAEQYERRFVGKDGRERVLLVSASPVQQDGAEYAGAFAMLTDITARQRVERAIRAIAQGAASSTGAEFYGTMTLALAETLDADLAAICELVSRDPARMRTLALSIDGELREDVEYELADTPCDEVISEGARCYASGVASLFPDDETLARLNVEAYVGVPLMGAEGRVMGVASVMFREPLEDPQLVETVLDVFAARTAAEIERLRAEEERLRLEREIQETQRLESLTLMAGGVAHDFNNILMGVLGNAELALEELPAGIHARSLINDIIIAATRAADLSAKMLAYSGHGVYSMERLDLADLVRDLKHLVDASTGRRVVVEFHLPTSVPVVRGDRTQLTQVTMNLVANAADAVDGTQGSVQVTVGLVEMTHADLATARPVEHPLNPGRYVYLDVTDTGRGMSPETLARAFDPFFSTKFAGRGLGLAATEGIVRSHRGAMFVESEEGKGTRVRVVLPLARNGEERHDEAGNPILVVDDEEQVRRVATRVLNGRGYAVRCAADGREAIDLLGTMERPALVLLDVTMPGVGGEAVLRELRAIDPSIPVILSSGFTEEQAMERLSGAEVEAFLHKPYRPSALLRTVESLLDASGASEHPPR